MAEIVACDSQHDSRSLEGVFSDERARLLAFLQRFGVTGEEEDILQDAWIRVCSLDRPVPAEPLSYLYRLLHNLVIDRRRQARARLQRDGQWSVIAGSDLFERCDQPGAERWLLAIDEVQAVHEVIDAMGEPMASIFRRHRLHGDTQRKIAIDFGMGLSTVEKYLRRAYAKLIDFREGFDD